MSSKKITVALWIGKLFNDECRFPAGQGIVFNRGNFEAATRDKGEDFCQNMQLMSQLEDESKF